MAVRRCGLILLLGLPSAVGFASPGLQSPTSQRQSTARAQLRGIQAPVDSASDAAAEAWPLQRWARGLLAAAAMFAVVASGVPSPARAEGGVEMYFGQGCFWHVQHVFSQTEVKELGRKPDGVTSLVGYAGGTKIGDKGQVCYHNMAFAPDYGQMGHTEVVGLNVPEDKVAAVAKGYLDDAARFKGGRADPQDAGGEYRSAIGLPGGMDSPLMKQLEEVNNGRMTFVKGEGNDKDTVNTKKIWVYDSKKFPFYQGEVYHQFHDDMQESYSDQYHKLKGVMQTRGSLKESGCPEVGF